MQSLFADSYSEDRGLLHRLGSGDLPPAERGLAAPQTKPSGAPQVDGLAVGTDPTLLAMRAIQPLRPAGVDSDEYVPDDPAQSDPSMASTVFVNVNDARPDTAPSPVVRMKAPFAPTADAGDTVLSMKRPRAASRSQPRPPAPALNAKSPPPRASAIASEPRTEFEVSAPQFDDEATPALQTVEARLDELPSTRPEVSARRNWALYLVVLLLLALAMGLVGLVVAHRKSAQRAGHLGQSLRHRPAQRGQLQRRSGQRQVDLARVAR
jgi:hypothetical protein